MQPSQREKAIILLEKLKQSHIANAILNNPIEKTQPLVDQIIEFDETYAGGLEAYYSNCLTKLNPAQNANSKSFNITIPEGRLYEPASDEHLALEEIGVENLAYTCFVLVAGGIGERLGYNDIKVSIPVELLTCQSYLEYYCQFILEYQAKTTNGLIPLCIMTSDLTDIATKKFLEENNYFGLSPEQIKIVKQGKVPSIVDTSATFAFDEATLTMEAKPHGHGDVHSLIYKEGLASTWLAQGKKYLVIFQDTNLLAFRAIPSALGASVANEYVMNTICVPRKPGEAVGALTKYIFDDGRSLTINTEYNVLNEFLDKHYELGTDVPDENGFSAFPGNTGTYVLELKVYEDYLTKSRGEMPEFINPKYKEASKTEFTSSARLECMAQDFPLLFKNNEKIGFISLPRWFCFSPCKNDLFTGSMKASKGLFADTAFSAEYDLFEWNKWVFVSAGGKILSSDKKEINLMSNLKIMFGAKIVMLPSFGISIKEIREKIVDASIFEEASVILKGKKSLNNITIKNNAEFDDGVLKEVPKFKYIGLKADEGQEYEKIRGYMRL